MHYNKTDLHFFKGFIRSNIKKQVLTTNLSSHSYFSSRVELNLSLLLSLFIKLLSQDKFQIYHIQCG